MTRTFVQVEVEAEFPSDPGAYSSPGTVQAFAVCICLLWYAAPLKLLGTIKMMASTSCQDIEEHRRATLNDVKGGDLVLIGP